MERIRSFINLKVVIGGILVSLCLLSVVILFLFNAKNEQPADAASTAVLYVIVAPTATPPVPIISATQSPTPTSTSAQSNTGGAIVVGAYVQITGTSGDGLRLRADPGLDGTVRFLAIDGEVFLVQDGPRDADGYIWWFLQAPYDPNVQGWAVADYMVVEQNP